MRECPYNSSGVCSDITHSCHICQYGRDILTPRLPYTGNTGYLTGLSYCLPDNTNNYRNTTPNPLYSRLPYIPLSDKIKKQ